MADWEFHALGEKSGPKKDNLSTIFPIIVRKRRLKKKGKGGEKRNGKDEWRQYRGHLKGQTIAREDAFPYLLKEELHMIRLTTSEHPERIRNEKDERVGRIRKFWKVLRCSRCNERSFPQSQSYFEAEDGAGPKRDRMSAIWWGDGVERREKAEDGGGERQKRKGENLSKWIWKCEADLSQHLKGSC